MMVPGDGEAHGSSCITLSSFLSSFKPQACGSSGMSNQARNQEYAMAREGPSLVHHLAILLYVV